MQPADDFPVEQLVGKRVAFVTNAEHAACWHMKAGFDAGLVLRPAPTPAQKAELLATEGIQVPETAVDDDDEPRLWIKVDPCARFPRGCEVAAARSCLVVVAVP